MTPSTIDVSMASSWERSSDSSSILDRSSRVMRLSVSANSPTSSREDVRTATDRLPPASCRAAAVISDSGLVRLLANQTLMATAIKKALPKANVRFR
jgi:hypothetical protein